MKALWKCICLIFITLLAPLFLVRSQARPVFADPGPFQQGDVFASVSDGLVQHYDGEGNLIETLDTGKGSGVFTTGCAFDSADDLYVTTFNAGDVIKFEGPDDPHTNLGTFGSGYSGSPESIVFDSVGNVYVGAVDGDNDIRKFDPNGNPLAQFNVATERRGSDWIDLARDQRTMFYTSEGKRILRYDVVDDIQLSDFTSSLPGSVAYALRILPDGGVLVADTQFIVRLDNSGNEIQRYDAPGEDTWFSLNLDPDGTSFWAGNFGTGKFYKFDIEAGGDPLLTVDTGVGATKLFGICVFGEKTEALSDMDGDGLLDDWEENGFDFDGDGDSDVDLPGMGAKKNHKDIFVYIDWLEESGNHSHRPDEDAINMIVDTFANAPVDNDDGETGINLHVVFGQTIEETDDNRELGSLIDDTFYNWSEFDNIKFSSFSAEMWPIFHYVIFGHDLGDLGSTSGISRNGVDFQQGASDFIVTLGSWSLSGIALTNAQAGTFMHELGHNLGLGHGGLILDDDGNLVGANHINYKPNHLSVMNYSFQTRGLRIRDSGGVFRDGNFDYSEFGSNVLPDLVETDLSEPDGLRAGDAVQDYGTRYYCQGTNATNTVDGLQQAVNWNCNIDVDGNDIIDPDPVSTDINRDGTTSTLTTTNVWPHLSYKGGAIGVFGVTIELPEVTSIEISPEITFEEDQTIGVIEVVIDIKPGSDPNSINCNIEDEVISVAILTTETFDATTVDHTTVTFEGASETHVDKKTGEPRVHEEDVDGDGDIDLVFHFRLGDTGLSCDTTEGTLIGKTFDGFGIEGIDAVRMVGETLSSQDMMRAGQQDRQQIYLPLIIKD